jgi:hypothetical protein
VVFPCSGSVDTGYTPSLEVVDHDGTYYDLGFYYEFQNLHLGWLATSGDSITVTGTGFTVTLWPNPDSIVWGPSDTPRIENLVGQGGLAHGFSETMGTITVGPSTTFWMTTGSAGSCTAGNSYTVAQLSSCFGDSIPFALWIGISPSSVGDYTATMTGITSTPYIPWTQRESLDSLPLLL